MDCCFNNGLYFDVDMTIFWFGNCYGFFFTSWAFFSIFWSPC